MAARETRDRRRGAGGGSGGWVLSGVGLAGLAVMGVLYGLGSPLYGSLLRVWMMDPWPAPFLDTRTVLGWVDCRRQFGLAAYDPGVLQQCGVVGPMTYPPIWMHLPLPDPAWTALCGLALAIAFMLSLRLLPTPAGPVAQGVLLAAIFSSAAAFALERANPDLLVWLLLIAAVVAAERPVPRHATATALVTVAAILKLYPLAALVLLRRAPPGTRVALVGAALLAVGASVAAFAPEWSLRQPIPSGSGFLNLWGAANAWTTLPAVLPRLAGAPADWPAWTGWCGAAVCAVASLAIAARTARTAPRPMDRAETLLLVAAALVPACFFAAQNVAYRGIFLILALPALLARAAPWARITAGAILFVLWQPTERVLVATLLGGTYPTQALRRPALALWLAQELAWWGIVGALLGLLVPLVIRGCRGNTRSEAATPIGRSEA